MDATYQEDTVPYGGYSTPAGVPTPAAPGLTLTLVKSLDGGYPAYSGTASSGAGWGTADALLSEEVQHPIHALGVPYLGIENLLQGSQGHSAPGA